MHTVLELVENYALALMHESIAFHKGEITAEMFMAAVDEIAGKMHNMVMEASGLR